MKGLPEDRAVQFARYIIEAGATVRETAKEFHISKSTVHKDIQERLPLLNYPLYREVRGFGGAERAIKSKGPPSLSQVGRTASFLFIRLGGSLAGRGTRAQPVSAPPKHTGKAHVARLRRAGLRPIPAVCGNSSLYTIQQPHFPACRPTKYLRQSPFYTPAK